jgi:hypothetical protein
MFRRDLICHLAHPWCDELVACHLIAVTPSFKCCYIVSFSLQLNHDVLQLVSPELHQLYQCLEVDFDPLSLCSKVMPILEGLESQDALKQYMEPLKDITLVRLIKQVKRVVRPLSLDSYTRQVKGGHNHIIVGQPSTQVKGDHCCMCVER